MASRSRPTQLKRQRERAQAERRNQKEARRQEAKARKAATPRPYGGGEDPDIAGIVPGPQPRLEEFMDDEPESEEEEVAEEHQ
jgi:hypothetical protein